MVAKQRDGIEALDRDAARLLRNSMPGWYGNVCVLLTMRTFEDTRRDQHRKITMTSISNPFLLASLTIARYSYRRRDAGAPQTD